MFSNHSEPKTMTMLCPLRQFLLLHNEQPEKKSPTCSITNGLKIKLCQWSDAKNISQILTGINIMI